MICRLFLLTRRRARITETGTRLIGVLYLYVIATTANLCAYLFDDKLTNVAIWLVLTSSLLGSGSLPSRIRKQSLAGTLVRACGSMKIIL